MDLEILISGIGLVLLLYRLQPWRSTSWRLPPTDLAANLKSPRVSIVIPCRNEEKNLPVLLESLKSFANPNIEILIVDDASTDGTLEAARRFGFEPLQAPEKPSSWGGKNWPCWIGAQQAQGEYLLFTDADTRLFPGSLEVAVHEMQTKSLDLMSAPPFFRSQNLWEKGTGFFHLLPLLTTAFLAKPKPQRLFSIGQYLLFRRKAYFEIGGHRAIASSLVEDLDLAKLVLDRGLRYGVHASSDLYDVQMYENFSGFYAGWKRILRLGMGQADVVSFLEIFCIFHLILTAWWKAPALWLAGVLSIAWAQSNRGQFWKIGALLAPLNVLFFTLLCLNAGVEMLMRKKIVWRLRHYAAAFVLLGATFSSVAEAKEDTLKVQVENLRSGRGAIAISVYQAENAKGFPGSGKPFREAYVELNGKTSIEVEIPDVPEGRYALSLMHDEDGDRKFKTNFLGIPKVGFGFSRNPQIMFGAPSFEDAAFTAPAEEAALKVKMKYML